MTNQTHIFTFISQIDTEMLRHRVSMKLYVLIALMITLLLVIRFIDKEFFDNDVYCRIGMSYPNNEPLRIVRTPDKAATSIRSDGYKKILYWTKMFISDTFYFGDGDIFASCPVWKCIATKDRDAFDAKDFDALMFHAHDIDVYDLPTERFPHQRYIFVNGETQPNLPIRNKNVYKHFFNWTMTYRRDSTLMRPYGVLRMIETNQYVPPHIPTQWIDVSDGIIDDDTRRRIRGKSRMVAWIVSNCSPQSRREVYAQALRHHIPLDIYGKCGDLQCKPVDNPDECLEMVERDYYFYLAFENSLCTDYVTEKAFNFLRYDVVPVVYGAADYATVLPPGSYIDIRDFKGPAELAEYLWSLAHNPELYASFFKWKRYYKAENGSNRYLICELCKKLHEPSHFTEVVEDLYSWWTKGQCFRPPIFQGV